MLMSIKQWTSNGKRGLGPTQYVQDVISKSCDVSFWGTPNKLCLFLISSAEAVIVYLDKLEEARFNERNMGVTFVSWGDTIREKTNRFLLLPHASP